MNGRRVSGPVAWLGVLTSDGRHITKLTLERLRGFPIMLHDDRPAPSGAAPVVASHVVGAVHVVTVDAAGVVSVEGVVNDDIDPGRYGVGIDLARTDTRPWGDGTHVDISGQLVAVTMYRPGSDSAPAFPDAHLVVEAS